MKIILSLLFVIRLLFLAKVLLISCIFLNIILLKNINNFFLIFYFEENYILNNITLSPWFTIILPLYWLTILAYKCLFITSNKFFLFLLQYKKLCLFYIKNLRRFLQSSYCFFIIYLSYSIRFFFYLNIFVLFFFKYSFLNNFLLLFFIIIYFINMFLHFNFTLSLALMNYILKMYERGFDGFEGKPIDCDNKKAINKIRTEQYEELSKKLDNFIKDQEKQIELKIRKKNEKKLPKITTPRDTIITKAFKKKIHIRIYGGS